MKTNKPDLKVRGACAVAFSCFECAEGNYVLCERPHCDKCGARAPTSVVEAIRSLDATPVAA